MTHIKKSPVHFIASILRDLVDRFGRATSSGGEIVNLDAFVALLDLSGHSIFGHSKIPGKGRKTKEAAVDGSLFDNFERIYLWLLIPKSRT